jgi:hypothetical protein
VESRWLSEFELQSTRLQGAQAFQSFIDYLMAEPTKQETEQVFRVLKAQKANKASRFAAGS